MSRPRVVIADDHEPTLVGVRLALEEAGFVVCAEERTGSRAVAAALKHRPDVCLLDIHMPGGGGIEATVEIRAKLPETQVVILTASGDDDDLFAALQAGASGYLLKGMDPAQLGTALDDVLSGGAALPPSLAARLIREFRARARHGETGPVRPGPHDLTNREWEVLDCLREGLSTKGIAERLFITDTTVRRHIGSILRKLEVSSREAAVEFVGHRSENLNGE